MPESAVALHTLSQLEHHASHDLPQWRLQELDGRLVELSDPQPATALSLAFLLLHEAQAQNRNCAWVGSDSSSFYPPDAADCGIDLKSLPVLRMGNQQDACRAAETLLRDGAFRLAVIDMGRCSRIHSATQARLHALVKRHQACALFLTERPSLDQSIGPLISLRGHTARTRSSQGKFLCRIHAVRDKRRGSRWTWDAVFSGIDGYC